ncbi:hypothetical protein ACQ4M3_08010 [Leptolyngbya sp. AN03gr2]|uniref:hypothetical protein n=1 Tax=unclassified Leptolyngbya TaxID=2650499 RepID=UPI003D31DF05
MNQERMIKLESGYCLACPIESGHYLRILDVEGREYLRHDLADNQESAAHLIHFLMSELMDISNAQIQQARRGTSQIEWDRSAFYELLPPNSDYLYARGWFELEDSIAREFVLENAEGRNEVWLYCVNFYPTSSNIEKIKVGAKSEL